MCAAPAVGADESLVYEPQAPPVGVATVPWRIRDRPRIPANVWFLGFTSLLTDISSEMVASVLPIYLLVQLGLSPLVFGALDGLSHGITALSRWVGGVLADRLRRYKEVAAVGYGLSAMCRLALLAAGGQVPALAAVVAADRVGKGIRTSPRDALISLSAPAEGLGSAFGVHRALDAAGAMLGPLVAFAVLAVAQARFDVVFVTAFSIAVVGLGVLVFFVSPVPASGQTGDDLRPSLRAAVSLFRLSDVRSTAALVSVLGLFTISDGFVYLALREEVAFAPSLFPLLFVGTSVSYMALAVPAGRLADRFGRLPVFLAGHLVLALTYAVLVNTPSSVLGAVVIVALLGAYYAATDGVVAALASGFLPAAVRGSGLAFIGTAHSLGRLCASVLFGWFWTQFGREAALGGFAVTLGVGVLSAAVILRGKQRLT